MVDMMKPVSLVEVKGAMRRYLYLGTVDKVRTALANEYSPFVPMPSAKAIQAALDERRRIFAGPIRNRVVDGVR